MAREISVSKLKAERRALASRLALLNRVISDLEKLTRENGHVAPSKPVSRRMSRTHAPHANGDAPTIRQAVAEIVASTPGIRSRDVVNRLVGQVALGSSDPKKLLSTRIGQFVKAGKLRREGDKLFLPE